MSLLILLALSCKPTKLTNITTEVDKFSVRTAAAKCVYYYPKSPCLVSFEKRGFQNYWAICGRKK